MEDVYHFKFTSIDSVIWAPKGAWLHSRDIFNRLIIFYFKNYIKGPLQEKLPEFLV